MPSVNGSRRRHTKQPLVPPKTDLPPALALTSPRSSPNSTSNTQSTTRSIFHSSLRPSKRPTSEVKQTRKEVSVVPKSVDSSDKENVDVFAFMEKEDGPWDSTPGKPDADAQDPSRQGPSPRILTVRRTEPSQMSPGYSDLEVRTIQDGVQRAWGRASLHSDSGISLHSGSPDPDSPILQHKYPMIQEDIPDALEATVDDDEPHMARHQKSPDRQTAQSVSSPRHWPLLESNHYNVPEACHVSPQRTSFGDVPFRQPQVPEMGTRFNHGSRPSKSAPRQRAGYDFLASSINSQDDAVLKPIYRKFEMLNNRMLLYLQDEISEIEEQLRELDAAIAQEDAELGKGPESRRSEAQLPSQLQWHRLDLLGRSFAKVEQYSMQLRTFRLSNMRC